MIKHFSEKLGTFRKIRDKLGAIMYGLGSLETNKEHKLWFYLIGHLLGTYSVPNTHNLHNSYITATVHYVVKHVYLISTRSYLIYLIRCKLEVLGMY
jgi:hypothetical protein